jgi:hypothetical protein
LVLHRVCCPSGPRRQDGGSQPLGYLRHGPGQAASCTSHLGVQCSAPAATRRTRRDHRVCCRGSPPPFSLSCEPRLAHQKTLRNPRESAQGQSHMRATERERPLLTEHRSCVGGCCKEPLQGEGVCGFALVCSFDLRTFVNGCRMPFSFSCQSARAPGPPSALPRSDRFYRPHHMCVALFHLVSLFSQVLPLDRAFVPRHLVEAGLANMGKLRCRFATAPAGAVWLTFRVSLAISCVRHLSSPQD